MVPPTQDRGREVPCDPPGWSPGFGDPRPRRQREGRAHSRRQARPRRGGGAAARQRESRDLTPFQAAGAARAPERLSRNGLLDTARANFRDRDRDPLEPRLRIRAGPLGRRHPAAPVAPTRPAPPSLLGRRCRCPPPLPPPPPPRTLPPSLH